MIHWLPFPLSVPRMTTRVRARSAKNLSSSGKGSRSSTDQDVVAAAVSSPALIPVLEPEDEWECVPLWDMPEYQQRKRRKLAIRDLPQLTTSETAAWNTIIREVFQRDEELALRYAMSHLLHSWALNNPAQAFTTLKTESRVDAINRRGLKRAEYEQMFRTWGDLISNIDDVGDIRSAATLLAEVTEYLDGLPTQAEKRLLVLAAQSSPFWRLITMLADRAEADGTDPEHVKQAYCWMEAWESLRRGLDISKGT